MVYMGWLNDMKLFKTHVNAEQSSVIVCHGDDATHVNTDCWLIELPAWLISSRL